MYLAKKNDNGNLPIYVSLFKRLACGDEIDSKSEIIDVLKETKDISIGEKDIYAARNDYYYLVSYLLSNGKDFLEGFDEEKVDSSTFQKIVDILSREATPAH